MTDPTPRRSMALGVQMAAAGQALPYDFLPPSPREGLGEGSDSLT